MEIINKDFVGGMVIDKNNTVYKCISYCDQPTITLEDLVTGKQVTHVVDCLNIQELELNRIDRPVEQSEYSNEAFEHDSVEQLEATFNSDAPDFNFVPYLRPNFKVVAKKLGSQLGEFCAAVKEQSIDSIQRFNMIGEIEINGKMYDKNDIQIIKEGVS
jgi:hypothetical protein